MKLIPLNSEPRPGLSATVDDEDYEYLMQWSWHPFTGNSGKNTYARRTICVDGKTKAELMHRIILARSGPVANTIDHKDRNGLNNQKSNLRPATRSQNFANRRPTGASKYLGVCISNRKSRKIGGGDPIKHWIAAITKNGRTIDLGSFPFTKQGEMLAAIAYDRAAKEIHGEFANLNFKTWKTSK